MKRIIAAGVAALVGSLLLVPAVSAAANDADVIKRGSCSGKSTWKLKASPENGRIEVEGEVDSNVNGQTWRWRIRHNGTLSAKGTAATQPPSGSFDVRRLVTNASGTDTIGWRARNPKTDEVCRGSLRF
jgi:hypothetical protein